MWCASIGPNNAGWTLKLAAAEGAFERYDFVVELSGPDCRFAAGTFQRAGELERFWQGLRQVCETLSGHVVLETDNAEIAVTVGDTGAMQFEASLCTYAFDQVPAGQAMMRVSQQFDPITVARALHAIADGNRQS